MESARVGGFSLPAGRENEKGHTVCTIAYNRCILMAADRTVIVWCVEGMRVSAERGQESASGDRSWYVRL